MSSLQNGSMQSARGAHQLYKMHAQKTAFKMLNFRVFLILVISVCVIVAQPTSLPPAPTDPTPLHTRHRGQLHITNMSPPLNCSACEDVVDIIVCGTDGNTYINGCRFKCAKLNNTDLDIKHSSVCEKDREGCSCIDDSSSKVCGTDGKTYDTKCLMWCENWVNGYGSTVQVDYDGPCIDVSPSLDSNKPTHYKDTAMRYNYATSRYNDAVTRYNAAAELYNTTASFYLEKAVDFSDTKTRHEYSKSRDRANQDINDAIHFIDEATHYIDEATRHVGEATSRIDSASRNIDELRSYYYKDASQQKHKLLQGHVCDSRNR